MEQIPQGTNRSERVFHKFNSTKVRMRGAFFDNIASIVAVVFTVALVIVLTTNISVEGVLTAKERTFLGAVLAFYYYTMYTCLKDNGRKNGKKCSSYISACERHTALSRKVVDLRIKKYLSGWIRDYVTKELDDTRESILATAGISLQEWQEKYRGITKRKRPENLTDEEFGAILAANKVKPIRLNAESLMSKEFSPRSRNPLGFNPRVKDWLLSMNKLFTVIALALVSGSIILNMADGGITWDKIASGLMQLAPGFTSMFTGYKRGYDSIEQDTVKFVEGKSSVLEQFVQDYENKERTPG